jgi:hypothetical protein
LWRRMATMIFITRACRAAHISITSMGRHIQNAKFATFPDCVRERVWLSRLTFFVDVYFLLSCSIIRIPDLLGVAPMLSHIIINRMIK